MSVAKLKKVIWTIFKYATLLLAIFIAVLVYAVALLKFHGLTEEELYSFPKGTTLIVYLKRFHLI